MTETKNKIRWTPKRKFTNPEEKKQTKKPTKQKKPTKIYKKTDSANTLFAREKSFWIFKSNVLIKHKEPVLQLMRNDGTVEWYTGVKSDEFSFEASNEKVLSIRLTPQKIHTFKYGGDSFKGYIAYEYESLPYPQNPLLTAEIFVTAIINTLNTTKDWKTTRIHAKTNMVKQVFIGIAIVGAIYILYVLLAPAPVTPTVLPSIPITP